MVSILIFFHKCRHIIPQETIPLGISRWMRWKHSAMRLKHWWETRMIQFRWYFFPLHITSNDNEIAGNRLEIDNRWITPNEKRKKCIFRYVSSMHHNMCFRMFKKPEEIKNTHTHNSIRNSDWENASIDVQYSNEKTNISLINRNITMEIATPNWFISLSLLAAIREKSIE